MAGDSHVQKWKGHFPAEMNDKDIFEILQDCLFEESKIAEALNSLWHDQGASLVQELKWEEKSGKRDKKKKKKALSNSGKQQQQQQRHHDGQIAKRRQHQQLQYQQQQQQQQQQQEQYPRRRSREGYKKSEDPSTGELTNRGIHRGNEARKSGSASTTRPHHSSTVKGVASGSSTSCGWSKGPVEASDNITKSTERSPSATNWDVPTQSVRSTSFPLPAGGPRKQEMVVAPMRNENAWSRGSITIINAANPSNHGNKEELREAAKKITAPHFKIADADNDKAIHPSFKNPPKKHIAQKPANVSPQDRESSITESSDNGSTQGTSFSLGKYAEKSGTSDTETEGLFFGFSDVDGSTWSTSGGSVGGWGDVVSVVSHTDEDIKNSESSSNTKAQKESNTAAAGFFDSVNNGELSRAKGNRKLKSSNGEVSSKRKNSSGSSGLQNVPTSSQMLSVEEVEAANADTDSENALIRKSPMADRSDSRSGESMPSNPANMTSSAFTAPNYPEKGVHPSGHSNSVHSSVRGKKHASRMKNNSGVGSLQQAGNAVYPIMQYGIYGQAPNSMMYAMGTYGAPGMMQIQGATTSQSSDRPGGSPAEPNNPGNMNPGGNGNISVGVGPNGVGVANNQVGVQQQSLQYQTSPGMMQGYGTLNGSFHHQSPQIGSGYAAAYQMGGMYGSPAGWNSAYPNQYSQLNYNQNPNGRNGAYNANGAVAGMQGYGTLDHSGQNYLYGMTGNIEYNSFNGQNSGISPGSSKSGHKSKHSSSVHRTSQNQKGSVVNSASSTGEYSDATRNTFDTKERFRNPNSNDTKLSMSRSGNKNSAHVANPNGSNVTESMASLSGLGMNGSSNGWNSGNPDVMWAQQMQYRQQFAMMHGQYQQNRYSQNNWKY